MIEIENEELIKVYGGLWIGPVILNLVQYLLTKDDKDNKEKDWIMQL